MDLTFSAAALELARKVERFLLEEVIPLEKLAGSGLVRACGPSTWARTASPATVVS